MLSDSSDRCRLNMLVNMVTQTQCFRESNFKHCKTAVLIEKNPAAFFAYHFESLCENYLACEHFMVRFWDKLMFLNLTYCLMLTFSQWYLVNLGVEIHLLNVRDCVDLGSFYWAVLQNLN